jgi:hypothetical protein
MSETPAAWRDVATWLAARAPASYSALRAGAGAVQVRDAERRLGAALPVALVALLQECDGTVDAADVDRDPDEYDPGLFLAQRHLLPLDGITAVHESADDAPRFWGPWIPFAVEDYALAPWSGLAVDAAGRLSGFRLSDGEPPSQPLEAPGYRSLDEFLRSLADAFLHARGPLMAEATPGLHQGALVWGPLPGESEPWQPLHGGA